MYTHIYIYIIYMYVYINIYRYIYIYVYVYNIYTSIYIYIYGNHKTLISHHGCSYCLVITGQMEQTIFCITFWHSPSSDASF